MKRSKQFQKAVSSMLFASMLAGIAVDTSLAVNSVYAEENTQQAPANTEATSEILEQVEMPKPAEVTSESSTETTVTDDETVGTSETPQQAEVGENKGNIKNIEGTGLENDSTDNYGATASDIENPTFQVTELENSRGILKGWFSKDLQEYQGDRSVTWYHFDNTPEEARYNTRNGMMWYRYSGGRTDEILPLIQPINLEYKGSVSLIARHKDIAENSSIGEYNLELLDANLKSIKKIIINESISKLEFTKEQAIQTKYVKIGLVPAKTGKMTDWILENISVYQDDSEERATQAVNDLFRDSARDALAANVGTTEIENAATLVDKLNVGNIKLVLNNLVRRARSFLDSKLSVDSLFEITDEKIRENLTQDEINEVKQNVENLYAGAWRNEQLERVNIAQNLFDAEYAKKLKEATEAVNALFLKDSKDAQLAEKVTDTQISAANTLVNDLRGSDEKTALVDRITKANVLWTQYTTAKVKVDGLFKNPDTEIKDGLTQEEINDATESVKKVATETRKAELTARVNKAQQLFNDAEYAKKLKEATDAVAALFLEGSDKEQLAKDVTNTEIQEAQTLVDGLHEEDQTPLTPHVTKANALWKQYTDAQTVVDGLFKDPTNDTEIKDGLTQKEITDATESVKKVATVSRKTELEDRVKKAQKLFDDAEYAKKLKEATDAVDALFLADSNKEQLAKEVTNKEIQEAQTLVNALEEDDKNQLTVHVTKANELWKQYTDAQTVVDSLFKAGSNDGELAEGVDQPKIDAAKAEVNKVATETRKVELTARVDKAQQLFSKEDIDKATKAVDDLFVDPKTDKELKAETTSKQWRDADNLVYALPESSAREALLKRTEIARQLLEAREKENTGFVNPDFTYNKRQIRGWRLVWTDQNGTDPTKALNTLVLTHDHGEDQGSRSNEGYVGNDNNINLYVRTVATNTMGVQQSIKTEPGKEYAVEINVNDGSKNGQVRITNDEAGTDGLVIKSAMSKKGTHIVTFIAKNDQTYVNFLIQGNPATIVFSQPKFREATAEDKAIAPAWDKVKALYEDTTYEKLNTTTDQSAITEASDAVKALAESVDKAELTTLVDKAQSFLDAKLAVDALFQDPGTDEKLADNMTQAKIDEAKAKVDALVKGAWKTEQTDRVNKAQKLFDDAEYAKKLKEATEAVDALFLKDSNKEQLAKDVTNNEIQEAQTLVDGLEDDDKNQLTADVTKANALWQQYTDAKTVVDGLFKDPTNDTEIKEGLTQAEIDTAKAEVNKVATATRKAELTERVDKAQQLFNEAEYEKQKDAANKAVDALFLKDSNKEQLAQDVTNTEIQEAQTLVDGLHEEDQTPLTPHVTKANALWKQYTDAQTVVDGLFKDPTNDTEIKDGLTQAEIDAAKGEVNKVATETRKAELTARVDKAQQLFDASQVAVARAAVDALFLADSSDSQLAADITRKTITDASILVENLKESADKEVLKNRVAKASTLMQQIEDAETLVNALFNGEELAANVTEEQIEVAETKVKEIETESAKTRLEAQIIKARELLKNRYQISVNEYKVGDVYITGTYTGNVKHAKVYVEGVTNPIRSRDFKDGQFRIYVGNVIKTEATKVRVQVFAGTGDSGMVYNELIKVLPGEVAEVTVNDYTVGDSYITGTYTGDIKHAKVYYQNEGETEPKLIRGGDFKDGQFRIYVGKVIKTKDTKVRVQAFAGTGDSGMVYNELIKVLPREVAEVTVNDYTVGDSYITGTYTGDIKHAKVYYQNEGETEPKLIRGGDFKDGQFRIYVGNVIKNNQTIVRIKAYASINDTVEVYNELLEINPK